MAKKPHIAALLQRFYCADVSGCFSVCRRWQRLPLQEVLFCKGGGRGRDAARKGAVFSPQWHSRAPAGCRGNAGAACWGCVGWGSPAPRCSGWRQGTDESRGHTQQGVAGRGHGSCERRVWGASLALTNVDWCWGGDPGVRHTCAHMRQPSKGKRASPNRAFLSPPVCEALPAAPPSSTGCARWRPRAGCRCEKAHE